ncbi:Hpt domain-containing protein [Arthrobacter sp. zg-Y859]|uniref:Hpt domain-containing protein n=2 Tax=Arthrobacter jinronghuae TaxID=2964609 RepID=A0ABT1NWJ6_9MICC|nr:Hpt domain-containing protein [Arthrobacter jinronghuae]MCQ1951089.1 Hpt domain-containing protein [Arthrobacter jinronghuae]UWX79540.1 Hpt domain-containing protein [Arthrobacter jinronghuae]
MFVSHSPAAPTGMANEPALRCTGRSADAERRCPSPPERQLMTPQEELEARLISMDRLRELSDQVGVESCRRFVSNFTSMWEGRFTRLHQAVQGRDFDAAMDVVLSIKISSHMAGAERLSALGAAAQDLVARRDVRGLDEMVTAVRACGAETMAYLNESDLFSAA